MVETTPLVVDGIMYLTEPPSNVVALDAATGRQYWRYRRELPNRINVCCGQVNRGVAILGDRVFVGTVDAHLVALDAKTGAVLWDVPRGGSHHRPQHHGRAARREGHGHLRHQRRRVRRTRFP